MEDTKPVFAEKDEFEFREKSILPAFPGMLGLSSFCFKYQKKFQVNDLSQM